MSDLLIRPFGTISWFLTRGLALLSLTSAARVPLAPPSSSRLLQLAPTKGAVVESGALWESSPVVALVLRRPG
jgi:hypothetical protein